MKFKSTDTWKEFKIGDFFDVKRGKRIVKGRDYLAEKNSEYFYNVITSTTLNNSVDGYYNKYNCNGNVLTCGGEATGMYTTYQEKKCWVMDRSRILTPKFDNFNIYIAQFLITIFNMYQVKYSYGNSANPEDIFNTFIKLPVDNLGNPDWTFMEKYIINLWKREKESKQLIESYKSNKAIKLQLDMWKEFKIGDFFDVKRGKRIVKGRDYLAEKNSEYFYNVITTTTTNNGVDGYYNKYNCLENSLIIAGEVNGFETTYQKEKSWVLDTSRILVPKFNLNKFIGFFLITVFEKNKIRFNYGIKAKPNDILNTIISLPVDNLGNPDWKYMENYIKSLPYSKYL